MNEYEIQKLKKELVRKNDVIKQMKEDLAFVEEKLTTVQAERDKYHGELQIARQTIQNVDQIIDQKVRQMKTKLEHENATSFNELQTLRDRLIEEQKLNQKFNEEIRNKDAVISQLSLRLREMSIKHKDTSLQINVKQISEQATITYNQFYKLTEKYNKLCENMENIMAENKILRKLHGVPDNFGFDLEEIKIAEKQELEDYKAQCRKLETEIEQLEAERTQLRYRLRQYNTLYSNKGERFKDLTQRQLELLDAYALNLKDGKDQLPQIDKSQKEMEREIIRLRAQVQILQSKAPINLMPGGKPDSQNNEMSKDSVKKIQDQIKGILEPFVQDIKKLSENNLNSIIQNVQMIQGDTTNVSVINAPGPTTGLRPPIPLPFANNDWSVIKDGYSYRYSCKFPVDLKDLETDVGFDIIKAKYEIAALQLQNMESLKMLKQKQDQEKMIRLELQDLKQKFKKCLLVQDEMFIKYFKTRDEYKENSKQTELEKRRITDERDEYRTKCTVLEEAFHALQTKTNLENQFKDLSARLAISEAGLVKGERKYQIIFEEHKYLKEAYTKMEQKAAQNEFHLKQKWLKARQNEKILTLLTNQVLDQTKDSVSSDTHNLLLSKMELLNDKSAHFAFKEAELRLKISRLESIEREMNIKNDMIEYLREDKLDLLLELEVLRNRLRSLDPAYRTTYLTFERLVGFINENSLSIMEYFKKFDKDKSGKLDKSEFQMALRSFKFQFTKDQVELLFCEFDLDGSGQLNYSEFLRKLKRGGAMAKNQDQKAIYLFFRAIKHANVSIKRAFEIVDKDGSGSISKTEMLTAFKQISIDCDSKTVDAIFRLTDSSMDDKISCSELEQLYFDVVKETQIDDLQFKPQLDWKYKFALKLEEAALKNNMTLKQTFSTLDDDNNSYMTDKQLSLFLTKAGVKLDGRNLDELFRFFDTKYDGKIEYNEFLNILDEARKEQKRVDRLVSVQKRAKELQAQNDLMENKNRMEMSKPTSEALLKIRMEALETKQTNLISRTKDLCKSLANKEEEIKDKERKLEENCNMINSLNDKYRQQRESNIMLEEKMKRFVGQAEAKMLKDQQKKMTIQTGELSAQLDTFKGLYTALTDKNKMELMSMEKTKAELNKHYDIVKELQATHIDKSELGRLAMELEYSKRNEEIVNKKYEDICEETKTLAKLNNEYSNESLQKQKEIVNTHLLMREKTNLLQKNIDTLTSKILPTISISKIDEFMAKLRQISSSKSLLEEQNKALREKCFNLQLKYDHIEIEKAGIIDLEKKLRRNYTDQSSVALIDLTKQLSEYKMAELKAKRECNLLKEKQEYYMRINNANNDNIKELEEELAKWEVKFNDREEFWRKRMADQMKLVDEIQREVQKTKDNQVKAQKYFNEKQIEEDKIEEQYSQIGEEREKKLSQFAKPPSYYKQASVNNEKIEELKAHVDELTFHLQQKEKEVYRLKTTLQELVPEEKLRFSSIGSQIGQQTNSYILQTELTTSQLKNNARRFLNNQKEQQNFFREEAERMAQAAQQSIDTLQRIIDDKNEQLRRKDKMIDDLKRDMLKNKEEDCYEIQKLNEEIRDLRSKREIASIDQLMNKSTHRQFYAGSAGNNDDKVKSLMEMIEDKDTEIRNWERKYNELYINKSKVKGPDTANNKMIENKLKELLEERESQKKKYIEAENKMKQKVKNLEKLIKQKDVKLAQLHKTITDLKADIVNQKQELDREMLPQNSRLIKEIIKGNSANDATLEQRLQKSKIDLDLMAKKNKEYEAEISKLRNEARMNKTMSRR